MKSPIKYYGGKSFLKEDVCALFPKDGSYNSYIEPFGGGASVLLHRKRTALEVYNDLGQNVYSLFKVLNDPLLFEKFRDRVCNLPYSAKFRLEFKESLLRTDLSLVDRSVAFFYVNRSSFNGVGGFAVSEIARRGLSKNVSDMLIAVDGLLELHTRLRTVVVDCCPDLECIAKYDNDRALFYVDPPYLPETRSSNEKYEVEMTAEQHIELLEFIKGCKGKFVISGYWSDLYSDMLKGWSSVEIPDRNYDGVQRSAEWLWWNYSLEPDSESLF